MVQESNKDCIVRKHNIDDEERDQKVVGDDYLIR